MTPPIRFLASALGSWACVRGAMLVPWQARDVPQNPATLPAEALMRKSPVVPVGALARGAPEPAAGPRTIVLSASTPSQGARPADTGIARRLAPRRPVPLLTSAGWLPPERLGWALLPPSGGGPAIGSSSKTHTLVSQPAPRPALSRWTGSAWVHARGGDAPTLAPGGLLGGSQAGARIAYRLAPALAIAGRLSAPLRRPAGAEAAIGVEWQPVRSVPLRLLGERRQKLGREGRSALALTLHGGVGELPLPAGFRLEAYGQAGVVGARSGDFFADASARAARPIGGGISLGAGLWGAAQPGVARLDIGPTLSLRLPQLGASLSADWRFRAAGGARPGSGPALTLHTDF
jgi:hypothetical protein